MLSILLAPLSPFGLILGAAAFVAALTPSMIPRPGVLQGVEAGIAFALLYGVGTGARALRSWLELPVAGDRYPRAFLRMSVLLCLALVGYGLVRETDWQNAIRRSMGMPAVPAGLPVLIAIVSAPVALFLIGLTRLFNASAMLISARLAKLVPRRSCFSSVSSSRRCCYGPSATASCSGRLFTSSIVPIAASMRLLSFGLMSLSQGYEARRR
jgi:uncharacterized membrane protein